MYYICLDKDGTSFAVVVGRILINELLRLWAEREVSDYDITVTCQEELGEAEVDP